MEQSSGRGWGPNAGKENIENPGPSEFPEFPLHPSAGNYKWKVLFSWCPACSQHSWIKYNFCSKDTFKWRCYHTDLVQYKWYLPSIEESLLTWIRSISAQKFWNSRARELGDENKVAFVHTQWHARALAGNLASRKALKTRQDLPTSRWLREATPTAQPTGTHAESRPRPRVRVWPKYTLVNSVFSNYERSLRRPWRRDTANTCRILNT